MGQIAPVLEQGIARVKIAIGDLIKYPVGLMEFTDANGAFFANNADNNLDGSFSSYSIGVTAGLGSTAGRSSGNSYGRVFGLRISRLVTFYNFTVIIDCVPYEVTPSNYTIFANDRESLILITDQLSDGPHRFQIILHSDPVLTKQINILGFLFDRHAGYQEHSKLDKIYFSGSLTTTAAAIQTYMTNTSNPLLGLRRIMYVNSDPASQTVNVYWNGAEIWRKTLTSGESATFEPSSFGINFGQQTAILTHKFTGTVTTGSITYSLIGIAS